MRTFSTRTSAWCSAGRGGEEEEEEGLFKADAVNEEDPEREEEEEEEEGLFKADAVNEEEPERDRATQMKKTCSAVLRWSLLIRLPAIA